MSFSQHKVRLAAPLRVVELIDTHARLRQEEKLRSAREKGWQDGFEAGQKSMSEQLVAQRSQLLEIQRGIFHSLSSTLPQLISHCERGLVKLAFESARRVVANLPITPELVEGVVREALSELQGISQYTLRLHPDDLALLQQIQSTSLPGPNQENVRVLADLLIERGGCMVDTPFGTIDATRKLKLQKVKETLLC